MNSNASSQSRSPLRHHPFPLLLYLEWGLLAIAILSELIVPARRLASHLPLLTIGSIIAFGVMGLRLPMRQSVGAKTAYIALAIGLIVLATLSAMVGFRLLPFTGTRLFPFLYIILVIRSCLIFRWKGQLTISGLVFFLFITMLTYRIQNSSISGLSPLQDRIRPLVTGLAVNSSLLFAISLVFVLFLVNALLAERRSRDQLTAAHDQLRDYALQIEALAMAQERNRIARDIHDSLGHSLTALNLQLEGALKLWSVNPGRSQTFLQEAKRLGTTALQEVRQSVAAMRSDPLQGQSLTEAIALLIQDVERSTGLQPQTVLDNLPSLNRELTTTVYRIVQEALTNICKYAQATQVKLTIQTTPTHLELTIQDNGIGFDPQHNQTGFGLQGMRERTLALGGTLVLTTAPHQGCRIHVRLPFTSPTPFL